MLDILQSIVDIALTIWVVAVPISLCVLVAIKKTRGFGIGLLGLCGFFLLIQPNLISPVRGATSLDWNPRTFWYEPGEYRVFIGV